MMKVMEIFEKYHLLMKKYNILLLDMDQLLKTC